MSPNPRKSAIVVPNKVKWHGHLAAFAAVTVNRALAATLRMRFHDATGNLLNDGSQPLIFAIWHNRLGLTLSARPAVLPPGTRAKGLTALISASKDGALLAQTLKYMRIQAVRGSSSRRGAQALVELTGWIEKGYHVAITPDGPRGPKYRLQEGIIALSQITQAPIIPTGSYIQRKKELRSWDAFQIPFPFSGCDFYFGEPFRVPQEIDEAEREKLRAALEAKMRAMNKD